jgi:hypothetical protein
MAAKSKRAKRIVRKEDIQQLSTLSKLLEPPKQTRGALVWDIDRIRQARDAQLRGDFWLPAQLAAAMRTDDALFTAYQNRLAPQRGLPVELQPANDTGRALTARDEGEGSRDEGELFDARGGGVTARAQRIRDEGEGLFGARGLGVSAETLANVNGDLANFGVSFSTNVLTPRDDGSRVDLEVRYWPIEHVRWDPHKRCYMTKVDPASVTDHAYEVPIVHGDGRWIVFSSTACEPWKHCAAVLPAALVWAAHAYARRDWSSSSKAHGDVKLVGELPEGIALRDGAGATTPEAQALLDMLMGVLQSDGGVGIRPAGSKTEALTNPSSAWQVFSELVKDSGLAAARIYLGTDGTIGTNPTGPGVDLRALFGVRNDLVESDVGAIERALQTGAIEIWTAINFGDSSFAPYRKYLLPDADESARLASLGQRTESFHSAIARMRSNGFVVDAAAVEKLAKEFDVSAPALPDESKAAPSVALAPTDIAKVVRVNEARASAGLGPLTLPTGALDPDGLLTVEQFSAKAAAATAPAPVAPMTQARRARRARIGNPA